MTKGCRHICQQLHWSFYISMGLQSLQKAGAVHAGLDTGSVAAVSSIPTRGCVPNHLCQITATKQRGLGCTDEGYSNKPCEHKLVGPHTHTHTHTHKHTRSRTQGIPRHTRAHQAPLRQLCLSTTFPVTDTRPAAPPECRSTRDRAVAAGQPSEKCRCLLAKTPKPYTCKKAVTNQ